MRNPVAATLLALGTMALLGLGCASRSVAPFEQGESRYRFSMLLSRGIGETGACAASVAVRDLAAKKKIVVPLFTAPWGSTSERAATDSAYGARLEVSVRVSADGTSGECRAVLMRGKSLIASRTETIRVVVANGPLKLKFR